jgi:hypothetical protein
MMTLDDIHRSLYCFKTQNGRDFFYPQACGGGVEIVRHSHLEMVRMCAQLEIVRQFLSIANS